jgi:hypothetical protein
MEITTTTAKSKLRNASNFVQYLLKGSETGLTCSTPIMDDPRFIASVNSCVFRFNPATVPTGKRPLFRPESGRHSVLKAAGIPVNPASC